MNLGALSQIFAGQERHAEAAAALKEAVEIVAPLVEKLPQAFSNLWRDYLSACEASGAEPDAAWLERVTRAIASAMPEEQQQQMAAMIAIFEKAQSTGELDGEALAALPPEIAEELRAPGQNKNA